MKKYLLYVSIVFTMISGELISQLNSEDDNMIRICTYNIRRMGKEKELKNIWDNRKGLVFDIIYTINPDVIGLQEVVKEQFNDLKNTLPDYDSFGEPRSSKMKSWWQKFVMKHPSAKDEHNPLFYNTKKLKIIEKGNFGINPRGIIMHAHLPRICTWGLFEDVYTGKQFYVYNTHLDDSSSKIRTKQINKILNHVKKHTGQEQTIIMGDFNARLSGKKERLFEKAGFVNTKNIAEKVEGPKETRTGWNNSELKIIDHIFVKPKTTIVQKHVVVESPAGMYPSDHRPVYVDIIE